jgi:cysteine desulfurase/selenocysteine lyase
MTITLDIDTLRKSFPILNQEVNGYPLVYLDNAATTQKPQQVIDAVTRYYTSQNANIHRGVHYLANLATTEYEATREKIRDFIHAAETSEIIFTSGTTDSINLVAQTWGRQNLKQGDEILITVMDHHSNIVPWQMIAEETGAIIKAISVNDIGEWDLNSVEEKLNSKTRLVAVSHVSNSLGTINPVKWIIEKAHAFGAVVLVDGAQSVAHFQVDVQALDADFYAFSGHKLYGPTGTGILYGKKAHLEAMPPYRGGGEMIKSVSIEKTTYNELPYKFEAGTPNIEGVVALGSAIDFITSQDWEAIAEHENELLEYATSKLIDISGLRIFGTSKNKVGVISFLVEGIHPYDLGTLLDKQGVAVRTGHHCTEPLWNHYGVTGSVRASFSIYTTKRDIELFIQALEKALQLLR